ncbi:hypothetical protein PENNAL_c0662G05461, partial [Penicillium nalgiovense]
IPFQYVDAGAPEVLGTFQTPRLAAPRPAAPSNRSLPLILSHRIVLYTEILRHGKRAEDEDGRGDGEGDVEQAVVKLAVVTPRLEDRDVVEDAVDAVEDVVEDVETARGDLHEKHIQ